jgi:hypothetical protein
MKPRKIILSLEILTTLPKKSFSKQGLQSLFDDYELDAGPDTVIDIHQVLFQAVKEQK